MKKIFFATFVAVLSLTLRAEASPASLGWWFLPDAIEDLPVELEEDDNGYWTELWLRPGVDSTAAPTEVMEQTLGARWVGVNQDKDGLPTEVILVMGNKVVKISKKEEKVGTIQTDKVVWNDNTKEDLFGFRRRRRRRSAKINFGKINLPPLASKTKVHSAWGAERLPTLLGKLPDGPDARIELRDLSSPAQIYDANGSFLNFRYDESCNSENRTLIEDELANTVEGKLTCWMEENPEGSSRLLGALLQRPTISCKGGSSFPKDVCGAATIPQSGTFFLQDPKVIVFPERCKGEMGQTLTHEILHLAGVVEKNMDSAVEKAEQCKSSPAQLNFENDNEGFLNDFEVQTRILVFRKVRDEAVDKWHWSEGERDFMLGTICTKMGDKYCARNYFQRATEEGLQGMLQLPGGESVTWSSVAQFEFYDSVTEDLQRMHELVHYLHRDPNGTLLRRIESGEYRLHEFFVARQALEAVKKNKGICSSETDEHVLCEDLAEIKKTPWFNRP